MKKHLSIEDKIASRIYGRARGCVVTPNDFLDLGSRQAVGVALHRMVKAGTLQRIARGLYYFPKSNRLLGDLSPSVEAIAKAISARDQVKLQPYGGYAANLLGLSEQVPAKVVFQTSGTARKLKVGKLTIELHPSSSRAMAAAGRTSGLVISALRFMGKNHLGEEAIARLRQVLSPEDRHRLLKDLPYAPAWMHAALRKIAAD